MVDTQTFWINLTNIALAVVTLLAVLAVLGGVAHELISRWKKRRAIFAELDADLRCLSSML
jgi:hypothetical protein